MKRIVIFLFCFTSVMAVAKENEFFAEDFANQSVIWVQRGKESKQCQAVRIAPKWYLTAAHCVRPYCDRECTVTVQLLNGPLQASALVHHSQAAQRVFVPPSYHPGKSKSIRSDIALLRFDPAEEDYWFVDVLARKQLDRADFIKLLNQSAYAEQRSQWKALETPRVRLLRVSNFSSRLLSLPIGVPDLRSGEIYFKQSQPNSFYYFPQLSYYMGPNFGVEPGMSGGGVVLPGGELVGVVSASLQDQAELVAYNEEDEPVASMPYSANYFLFTPISSQNASFIKATVASFHDAAPGVRIGTVSERHSQTIEASLQDVFTEFSSAQDIHAAKER